MVRWRPGEGIWGYWKATSAVTESFCTLAAILGSDAWRPANGSQQEDIVHEGPGLQAWWMFVAQRGRGGGERDNSECFIVEGHLTHYKWYDYKHAHTTYTKQLTKQTRPKKQKQNKKRNRHEQRKRGGRERDRQTETHRDRERQKDKDRQRLRQRDRDRQTETETDLIIHVYTCSMLRHTSTHTN